MKYLVTIIGTFFIFSTAHAETNHEPKCLDRAMQISKFIMLDGSTGSMNANNKVNFYTELNPDSTLAEVYYFSYSEAKIRLKIKLNRDRNCALQMY